MIPMTQAAALCAACVSQALVCPPVPVSGGFLHTMMRADTESGSYAVKILNPTIMQRPEAADNMRRGEEIAKMLSPVIPVIHAIPMNGDVLRRIDGQDILCYPWVEGKSLFYPELTPMHCAAIGAILGQIHTAGLPADPAVEMPEPEDWQALLQCSHGKAWEADLEQLLPDCIHWDTAACMAARDPRISPVLSHRDLDPKNVLWQDERPFLIDWEAAGSVDPDQELLTVLRYWTCAPNGAPMPDHARAFLQAYRAHRSLNGIPWRKVMDAGYCDLLGWLAYNIRRGTGQEAADKAEMILGAEQVTATIQALTAQKETEDQLLALFAEYAE